MAAIDMFRHYNETLPAEARAAHAAFVRQTLDEILVARSEDARQRLVEAYTREMTQRLRRSERSPRGS